MYTIQELLNKYQDKNLVVALKSERSELIQKFEKRLNADRAEAGLKPMSAGFISMRMAQSGLRTQDLYWFYSYCEDAQNFSKTWWWSMKPQDKPQKTLF